MSVGAVGIEPMSDAARFATASIASTTLPLSLPWVTIRIVGLDADHSSVASARLSLARSGRHAIGG
jgi:hypothetical protein